jgi:hypothetical protein
MHDAPLCRAPVLARLPIMRITKNAQGEFVIHDDRHTEGGGEALEGAAAARFLAEMFIAEQRAHAGTDSARRQLKAECAEIFRRATRR